MRSPNAFMLQREEKHTLCDTRTRVCVLFGQNFSYIIQMVESEYYAGAL